MPTLRQLNALSVLQRTSSFTRAADQLSLTQSAVSMAIRELEDEVGTTLVIRGRALRLTPAGNALAECGARCTDDIARTLEGIRAESQLRRGRLTLAVGHVSAATYVPAALAVFARRFPDIVVRLLDVPVERVSQLVSTSEADVGVGAIDADPSMATLLDASPLVRDQLWAVMPRSPAPRASKRSSTTIRWRALPDAGLILVTRVPGQWRELFLRLQASAVGYRIAHEVALFPTALEMVHRGLGIALLPGFVARGLDASRFDARPLRDPITEWQVHWLSRKGAAANPAAAEMRRAIAESLQRAG